MLTLDPLKSAISFDNVDYTSLALPSVNEYRSGQQRVLEQVQTVTRSKCRQSQRQASRSGSGPTTPASPISPLYDNVFTDSFKSLPPSLNGSRFSGNGLSKMLSQEKTVNRRIASASKGATVQRNSYHYEQGSIPVIAVAHGRANTSRSEPDSGGFVKRNSAVPSHRLQSNKSNTLLTQRASSQFVVNGPPLPQPPRVMNGTSYTNNKNSQFIVSQTHLYRPSSKHSTVDGASKSKGDSGSSNSGSADMTMRDAVEYLSHKDEMFQHCGASFIQHNTFVEDAAKQEVLKLHGVVPLVGLLRSPNPQVYQTASAALRNLSFQNSLIKDEVHRCGGIKEAAALLRETDSSETQKQLTGLLWNLSSVDGLKPDLLKSALPVLMESVILPYTTGPDSTINYSLDPDVFFHASGCLRNLSSAKQSNRQALRKCRGLVDSLVCYVQNCVVANRPDDKSVENCACILHNLTFQLEAEAPDLFNRITALSRTASKRHSQGDTGPIGCFSSQSSKVLEQERHFDYPVVEELHPKGAGWLIHSKTLQSYLSLMGSSQRDDTLEACCGALQNLTATQGIVSSVMGHTIVQKLNGLQVISPLLKSPKPNLQRNTVALVGNLAQNQNLQSAIARKALPELTGILSSGTKEGNESDDTLAMACQTAHCLLRKEPELGKRLLSNNLINSLKDLSQNKYFPKASKGAALLLYSLWSDKELQNFLKKQGMNKAIFVNDVTTAALKSVQVVE